MRARDAGKLQAVCRRCVDLRVRERCLANARVTHRILIVRLPVVSSDHDTMSNRDAKFQCSPWTRSSGEASPAGLRTAYRTAIPRHSQNSPSRQPAFALAALSLALIRGVLRKKACCGGCRVLLEKGCGCRVLRVEAKPGARLTENAAMEATPSAMPSSRTPALISSLLHLFFLNKKS